MPITDQELMDEFIRVERISTEITVSVCVIEWHGPHTPVSHWQQVYLLPLDSSERKIQATIKRVLNRKQFFRVCQECGERNPDGWMHSKEICHSCAERNHGIVY